MHGPTDNAFLGPELQPQGGSRKTDECNSSFSSASVDKGRRVARSADRARYRRGEGLSAVDGRWEERRYGPDSTGQIWKAER